jgi:RNA-directed DNA polymerase
MKLHRDLFAQVCSFENLHRASRAARRGKRDREEVAAFEYDAEKNLLELQAELLDGGYRPGSTYRASVCSFLTPHILKSRL